MDKREQLRLIKQDFQNSRDVLVAIGDETRQLILMVLMETDCKTGMRVGEITAQTHLSRPAVSHQLRILKDAGIVQVRGEGTMNFYSINITAKLEPLKTLMADIDRLMKEFY